MIECLRVAVDRKVFLVEGNLATIPHVPAEAMRVHRFPFPPRAVQDHLLAHLREQRAEQERVGQTIEREVALLQERKQSLITAAVTGELDVTKAA